MTSRHDEILPDLQGVFRTVFDDDDLVITDATTAADVDGWDSMAHIGLIIAIEKRFGVKFSAADLASLRGSSQAVGHLIELVAAKTGAA